MSAELGRIGRPIRLSALVDALRPVARHLDLCSPDAGFAI
jgi:hypothetical protein